MKTTVRRFLTLHRYNNDYRGTLFGVLSLAFVVRCQLKDVSLMSQFRTIRRLRASISVLLPLILGFVTLVAGCSHHDADMPGPGETVQVGSQASAASIWSTVVNVGHQGVPQIPIAAPGHVGQISSWGEPSVVAGGTPGPRAVASTDGPYLLDTGDRLRVFVYGQPNLSRLYIVDHDGKITVPLIGAVKARAHTTYQLEAMIRSRLGSQFVKDPQVTVDVQQNRPFFILGEVRNAGQYPYVSGMTAETAVAIAGGFSERANERKVRISRRNDGLMEVIEAPTDYIVQPGDTVYVYERFF
jgi:polysaccharide biosynthesis/export protein